MSAQPLLSVGGTFNQPGSRWFSSSSSQGESLSPRWRLWGPCDLKKHFKWGPLGWMHLVNAGFLGVPLWEETENRKGLTVTLDIAYSHICNLIWSSRVSYST